jgi:hypothetical protein
MTEGPGNMHKELSPLTFCADGGEDNMPSMAYVRAGRPTNLSGTLSIGETQTSYQYSFRRLWRIQHSSYNLNQFDIMPRYLKADWAFIVSVLMSFVGILFTLAGALQDVLLDTAILSLLAVFFFMAAYISFLNRDVR